jgi:hypothetical protein
VVVRFDEIAMSYDSDEFTKIQQLLALKRHEQPPPGYYNTFSAKVIARIESQQLAAAVPWWQRWLSPLSWRHGLIGANALIVAGVGLLGFSVFHVATTPAEDDEVTWAPTPLAPRGPWTEPRLPESAVEYRRPVLAGVVNDSSFGLTQYEPGAGGSGTRTTNDHVAPPGLFGTPGSAEFQHQVRFVFPRQ